TESAACHANDWSLDVAWAPLRPTPRPRFRDSAGVPGSGPVLHGPRRFGTLETRDLRRVRDLVDRRTRHLRRGGSSTPALRRRRARKHAAAARPTGSAPWRPGRPRAARTPRAGP